MASASKRRARPAPPPARDADADMREGLALFRERRFAEACARFEAAAARKPRPSGAVEGLAHSLRGHADVLVREGKTDQALAAYEKAVRLLPKDAGLLMSLARLRLRLDDPEGAQAALRKAVKLEAGGEASLLLGSLLQKKGASRGARAHLLRAAEDKPAGDDSRARMAAGLNRFQAQVKLGAFPRAFAEAEALLAAEGSQECIDSFFVSPEPSELMSTLDALKAVSARDPKSPWPYYFRASLLTNAGRGEEAILETEKLRGMPARYDWMRHKHGEFLLASRRDYEAARAEYEAAAACVPGFWKARAALAEIALCQGRVEDAVALARGLAASEGSRTKNWGHACLGKLLLWSGRYEEALEALGPAVDAGVPYALRHRGAARLMLGRLDEAAEDLEAALRQSVDAEGLTWRGELRRKRGDLRGCLEDLGAAVRMDSSNAVWALANRALAKAALGDAAGAWSDYSSIRRDVLDRFEKAAGEPAPRAEDPTSVTRALEKGLSLARGLRLSNEYLFPVWMSDAARA